MSAQKKSLPGLLATEVDTEASRLSTAQVNPTGRGLGISVKIENLQNSPSYTPHVDAKMPNGDWVTIWTAAAALTANGTVHYLIYPGTAGAVYTEYEDTVIPLSFRVGLTYVGTPATDNADTTVDAEILP